MAPTREKYPDVPARAWWTLRKEFRKKIPSQVNADYLSMILGIKEVSARSNVLPGLRAVGLIDEDGTPTERANRWRDDETYPDVCREILEETYPETLLHGATDPDEDRAKAQSWFMRNTGYGQSAANKMAAFYALLLEADPTEGKAVKSRRKASTNGSGKSSKKRSASSGTSKKPAASNESKEAGEGRLGARPGVSLGHPGVSVSLEIRLGSDMSADQIDQVFASMAKHLYQTGDGSKS